MSDHLDISKKEPPLATNDHQHVPATYEPNSLTLRYDSKGNLQIYTPGTSTEDARKQLWGEKWKRKVAGYLTTEAIKTAVSFVPGEGTLGKQAVVAGIRVLGKTGAYTAGYLVSGEEVSAGQILHLAATQAIRPSNLGFHAKGDSFIAGVFNDSYNAKHTLAKLNLPGASTKVSTPFGKTDVYVYPLAPGIEAEGKFAKKILGYKGHHDSHDEHHGSEDTELRFNIPNQPNWDAQDFENFIKLRSVGFSESDAVLNIKKLSSQKPTTTAAINKAGKYLNEVAENETFAAQSWKAVSAKGDEWWEYTKVHANNAWNAAEGVYGIEQTVYTAYGAINAFGNYLASTIPFTYNLIEKIPGDVTTGTGNILGTVRDLFTTATVSNESQRKQREIEFRNGRMKHPDGTNYSDSEMNDLRQRVAAAAQHQIIINNKRPTKAQGWTGEPEIRSIYRIYTDSKRQGREEHIRDDRPVNNANKKTSVSSASAPKQNLTNADKNKILSFIQTQVKKGK